MAGKHSIKRIRERLSLKAQVAVLASLGLGITGAVALDSLVGSASETAQCSAASFSNSANAAGDYCGDLALVGKGLAVSATNHPVKGSKVQVLSIAKSNGKEDLLQLKPYATSGPVKVFAFAPHGALYTDGGLYPNGLCISVPSSAVDTGLIWAPCFNAQSEKWTPVAVADGFHWRSNMAGLYMADPRGGPEYTQLQIRNWSGTPNQIFTANGFGTPPAS